MKLWKRVYLLTLIIITVCVNVGLYGIVYFTYSQMLEAEKERCQTEYIMLRQSLSSDIAQMEKSVELDGVYFQKYINAYNSYYDEETTIYGIVNDVVVGDDSFFDIPIKENGIFIYDEGETTIYLIDSLDENHKEYRVVLEKSLADFDKIWDTLLPLYIVGGIVVSLGVSLILAVTVRILLRPIERLEIATRKMQEGDMSERVSIGGEHELARLGRQFNSMADAVEENIQKLKEQALQKEELINNLAHEMNTPITSIKGFAEYMKMTELSVEEREECLDFIVRESTRLKDIAAILLSMARLENYEDILQEEFYIKDLCKELMEIYTKQMIEYNIAFSISCEIERMKGNPMLIESLLRNMIVNSVGALMGRDNKRISIKIYDDAVNRIIQVEDNGCGIDESHIEHIFEPFYRVDKARSKENGGSGLGLPFCRKIVELHNGEFAVKSEVDKGTIFTATFTV